MPGEVGGDVTGSVCSGSLCLKAAEKQGSQMEGKKNIRGGKRWRKPQIPLKQALLSLGMYQFLKLFYFYLFYF